MTDERRQEMITYLGKWLGLRGKKFIFAANSLKLPHWHVQDEHGVFGVFYGDGDTTSSRHVVDLDLITLANCDHSKPEIQDLALFIIYSYLIA
jgi:hypothetical protein